MNIVCVFKGHDIWRQYSIGIGGTPDYCVKKCTRCNWRNWEATEIKEIFKTAERLRRKLNGKTIHLFVDGEQILGIDCMMDSQIINAMNTAREEHPMDLIRVDYYPDH